MLTILQISDIHFQKTDNAVDEYAEMRQRMKDCILDFCEKGKIDFLMICGDIAFSGSASEYNNKAKPFINDLLKLMGGNPNQVYVIPGNHDKDREAKGKHTRAFLRDGLLNDKHADAILSNIKQEEPDTIAAIYKPFHDYMEFANEYDSLSGVAKKVFIGDKITFNDNMYWSCEIGKLGNYTVELYGINSCLASDDKDDKEHRQVLPKMAYKTVQKRNIINISMMHHPMDFINNNDVIKADFDNLYIIQFYGHLHRQTISVDNAIKVFSGALQPDHRSDDDKEKYRPVFNIIQMDVNKDMLLLKVKPYVWDIDEKYPTFKIKKDEEFSLDLTRLSDTKTPRATKRDKNLPEGISERDIKIRLMKYPHYHDIIKKMNNDFELTGDKAKDCIKFFEWVSEKGDYLELHNILVKYEG